MYRIDGAWSQSLLVGAKPYHHAQVHCVTMLRAVGIILDEFRFEEIIPRILQDIGNANSLCIKIGIRETITASEQTLVECMTYDAVNARERAAHVGDGAEARFMRIVDCIGYLRLERILLVVNGIETDRGIEVALILQCCFCSMGTQLGIDLADKRRIALEVLPEPVTESTFLLRIESVVDPQSYGERRDMIGRTQERTIGRHFQFGGQGFLDRIIDRIDLVVIDFRHTRIEHLTSRKPVGNAACREANGQDDQSQQRCQAIATTRQQ